MANEATLSSVPAAVDRPRGMNGSASRRSLPGQLSTGDFEQWPQAAGRHQVEAVRDGQQPAVADDQRAAARIVGRQQLVGDAEPAAEVDRVRDFRLEAVGRALDEEAVAVDGVEDAAEAVGGLEERQFGVRQELGESMRGGQAADAAADDGDAGGPNAVLSHCRSFGRPYGT